MSSLDNLTLIASSNEFCASCGGANCGGASSSAFTCLQSLDISEKLKDKLVVTEPESKTRTTTRVKKWVGEVDLPESAFFTSLHILAVLHTSSRVDMEPLLQENKRRFVLFPIQYPDVSVKPHVKCSSTRPLSRPSLSETDLPSRSDLEDVQEGRGVLLDRGGDGPSP